MVILKHNLINDLLIIIKTLIKKQWLDKNRIFYYLTTLSKYKNINYDQKIVNLKFLLDKYRSLFNDKDYKIYLSKYGPWGSYQVPNRVYINVQRNDLDIVMTIIHEIVHLKLEAEIIKRGLGYEAKEKLVQSVVDEQLKKLNNTP